MARGPNRERIQAASKSGHGDDAEVDGANDDERQLVVLVDAVHFPRDEEEDDVRASQTASTRRPHPRQVTPPSTAPAKPTGSSRKW